jgi:hypothetical protein
MVKVVSPARSWWGRRGAKRRRVVAKRAARESLDATDAMAGHQVPVSI